MAKKIQVKRTIRKIKKAGTQSVPSLFTIGNMACGFFSILSAVNGNYYKAGWLILIAMLLDGVDGRIARLLKVESSFGVEMDSLADIVSFCMAPAFLMYFMALQYTPVFGGVVAFIYTLFGALRLAKFNAMAYDGTASKNHFSGLPTPAAAAILASFAISYSILTMDRAGANLKYIDLLMPHIYNMIILIMLLLSALMVSNIPYASFKGGAKVREDKTSSLYFIALVAILAFLLIKYPQDIVFIVFSGYVLVGIFAVLFKAFKNIGEKDDDE